MAECYVGTWLVSVVEIRWTRFLSKLSLKRNSLNTSYIFLLYVNFEKLLLDNMFFMFLTYIVGTF